MAATPNPSEETALQTTPPQILGPFYPFMHTPTESGDLTGGGKAHGPILYLSGRVLNKAGQPVAGARVEIWQANAHGRYAHPNDDTGQPLDPDFNGFAVTTTDAEGHYEFKTVRPKAYEVSPERWRPAHIHFSVIGKTEQLVTQMYFKGEKWNETDSWLNSARNKEVLIADPQPRAGKESGALELVFDIVLMKG
ncbi:MAG: protocatechuate 3,4-dioxygenase beta subunit [Gammaproteobacteria bacterium]|jgi:protocatechuate 3,4-dioxygenase beta subunit